MSLPWLLPAIVLLALALLTFVLVRPRVPVVPDEERLVIYRLGRFSRIAGPGPVLMAEGLETIERVLHVRNQPVVLRVAGVFVNGISMNLTFNLWCCVDPVTAAGKDARALANMARFDDNERRNQMEVELRRLLIQEVNRLWPASQLPPNPSPIDKILVIIPGAPICARLLVDLSRELEDPLRALGVIVDRSHALTITDLEPPADIVAGLSRGRVIELLRQTLPDLSDDIVAHLAASIEGREPLNLQHLLVKGDAAGNVQQLRRHMPGSNGGHVDVTLGAAGPAAAPQAAARTPDPAPPALTDSDWKVLKRVPRRS